MLLEGSCHCGAVHYTVQSNTPYPYMYCYCSICRKTAGGGGYAINLMGLSDSLTVEGEQHLKAYQARLSESETSPGRRYFCGICASALWVADPRWPALIHPFASSVDTPLPDPLERQHIMLNSKANWVRVPAGAADPHFDENADLGIADWHRSKGLLEE